MKESRLPKTLEPVCFECPIAHMWQDWNRSLLVNGYEEKVKGNKWMVYLGLAKGGEVSDKEVNMIQEK